MCPPEPEKQEDSDPLRVARTLTLQAQRSVKDELAGRWVSKSHCKAIQSAVQSTAGNTGLANPVHSSLSLTGHRSLALFLSSTVTNYPHLVLAL